MFCSDNHDHSCGRYSQAAFMTSWPLICAFTFHAAVHATPPGMFATFDRSTGCANLMDGERLVLTYNYHRVVPPDGLLDKVHADSQKFAQPRSNYIHPLCGPKGEILTEDWPQNHPHHRGIYWAWPEVDYQGERGDLHALQRVFARPTGKIEIDSSADFAEIKAENLWKWEDKTAIVRELAVIRAYPIKEDGRPIDLRFSFTAIQNDVSIARRRTNLYGGLNFRLSPVSDLEILKYTDPENAAPRRAWADINGIPSGGVQSVGIAIFQKQTNLQYPGQWIDFPELPWLQPTFPTEETRYTLKKDTPLVLEYRLWIHSGGKMKEADYDTCWKDYQTVTDSSEVDETPEDSPLRGN